MAWFEAYAQDLTLPTLPQYQVNNRYPLTRHHSTSFRLVRFACICLTRLQINIDRPPFKIAILQRPTHLNILPNKASTMDTLVPTATKILLAARGSPPMTLIINVNGVPAEMLPSDAFFFVFTKTFAWIYMSIFATLIVSFWILALVGVIARTINTCCRRASLVPKTKRSHKNKRRAIVDLEANDQGDDEKTRLVRKATWENVCGKS